MSDAEAAENLRALMSTWEGAPPYAWKVAINFERGQRRLGLQHFVTAPLRERIHLTNGLDVQFAPEQKVFVEAEVAVRVGDDGSIEAIAPCLEIVDYALPGTTLRELLAHSFFHAGIVLGAFLPAAQWTALRAPYPRAHNGKVHERVEGVVDDDLSRVVSEVAKLARDAGAPLRGGQLVLCGSYIEPLALKLGSRIEVDYGPALPKLSVGRVGPQGT